MSASPTAGPPTAIPPTASPTASPTAAPPTAGPSPDRCAGGVPAGLSVRGDRRNAWAFAPLDRAGDVVVEGQVSDRRAWSTSKVLVVAAYLRSAAHGDPRRVSARNRDLIAAALTRSDADAVTTIRAQIPGRPGPAMTAVLREIGDRETVAPDSYQGTMAWSLREQVRFVAALADGRVVSAATSRYLRDVMHPIAAHAWGLGRIGATTYKGGWLRADTGTRQLGLVSAGGRRYAVALVTTAGPAVRQTDGDSAHVAAIDVLARRLAGRLGWESRCR